MTSVLGLFARRRLSRSIALLICLSATALVWIGYRVVVEWEQAASQVAARRAEAAGLTVVMNRCPKIEWGRLNRELSWGGVNSKIISSRRRLEARR